jgi:erythronate-4-phosphate dehydrogenase
MKIVADSQIPLVAEAFSRYGDVTLYQGRDIGPAQLADADVLLVRSVTRVDARLLQDSKVRFVGTATSGIDHVDREFLEQAGIGFIAAAGSNAQSVVEYVLSSLFALASQQDIRLSNQTVGIIGCGQVGSRLLEELEVLGVQCLINDPPLKDKTGDEKYRELEALYQADVLTLHVPLTVTGPYPSRHLLDKTLFSAIKTNAIIINTARGGVVNEQDLQDFLARHPDASVVLDVWENEPAIDQDLLAATAIGTPHIAGYSLDGKIRATEMVYKGFCDYFSLEKHWHPVFRIMDAGLHNIRIDAGVTDEEALQYAVLGHYDVRSDAAALRRMIELDVDQREFYFDELRKNYPARREFGSTGISVDKGRTELIAKLGKLGFRVVAL